MAGGFRLAEETVVFRPRFPLLGGRDYTLLLRDDAAADWAAAQTDDARKRVVVDQVASLTDVSAMAWHSRLS